MSLRQLGSTALLGLCALALAPAASPAHAGSAVQATPDVIVAGSSGQSARTSIRFRLDRRSRIAASITRDGSAVRTLFQGSRRRGAQRLLWDGLDEAGQPVAPGTYSVIVRIRAARHRERAQRTKIVVRPPLDAVSPAGFRWPVDGDVSSGFGPRGGSHHDGIDIIAAPQTPIVAPADGTVTFAGTMDGYGNTVKVFHPASGYTTLYAHQASISVASGDSVTLGQVIGSVGNTGHTTAYHLHFEVHTASGAQVDPLPLLPPR